MIFRKKPFETFFVEDFLKDVHLIEDETFERCEFVGSKDKNINFYGTFRNCQFKEVIFKDYYELGSDFYKCQFDDVKFCGNRNEAVFTESTFSKIVFSDKTFMCGLVYCYFSQALEIIPQHTNDDSRYMTISYDACIIGCTFRDAIDFHSFPNGHGSKCIIQIDKSTDSDFLSSVPIRNKYSEYFPYRLNEKNEIYY